MLHAGLDLSRKRVDVCLVSDQGELLGSSRRRRIATVCAGSRAGSLRTGCQVRGVVESMNGARFVRDELAAHGWEVLIADAQRVKGLAPLACETDKVDARVLAELSFRDLVPATCAARDRRGRPPPGRPGRARRLRLRRSRRRPGRRAQCRCDAGHPGPRRRRQPPRRLIAGVSSG